MKRALQGKEAGRVALFVSGIDGFCHRYGVLHRARAVAGCGFSVRVLHYLDPRLVDACRAAAILFLYRVPASAAVEAALVAAAGRGCPRVGLLDDRLYAVSASSFGAAETAAARAQLEEGALRYRAVLQACDALLAATPALAEDAVSLGLPVEVHADSLSDDEWRLAEEVMVRRARQPDGVVRLGYASGTPTHDRDFEEMAEGIAAALAEDRHLRLELRGPVSVPGVLRSFAHRIERAPLVGWTDLPAALAETDIQLAPLDRRDPFSRCKGATKFLEAGALGLPIVASPTPMHEEWIENGRNGSLAGEADAVKEAILHLAGSPRERTRLGEAARETVRQNFRQDTRRAEMARFLEGPLSAGSAPTGWEDFRQRRPGEAPGEVALEADACPLIEVRGETGETTPPLCAGSVLEQVIPVERVGLARLDVGTVTFDQAFRHALELRLFAPGGELHASSTVLAGDLPDRRFFAWTFAPVGARGSLRLEIRARDTGPGDAASFLLAKPTDGRPVVRLDGRPLAGSLALRGFADWQSVWA